MFAKSTWARNQWWLSDGHSEHYALDTLLDDDQSDAASVASNGSVGSTVHDLEDYPEPEPAPESVAAAAAAPTREFKTVVRQSKTTPGVWYAYHKELQMSRWVTDDSLLTELPSGLEPQKRVP